MRLAGALYDGGWRSSDMGMIVEEYGIQVGITVSWNAMEWIREGLERIEEQEAEE